MREHARARREPDVRARAWLVRRPPRGATPVRDDLARGAAAWVRSRRGYLGSRLLSGCWPTTHSSACSSRRARPATCWRGASNCTSSSRASTTSGVAGTGFWSCAPRRRRSRGDKRPLRGFTEAVEALARLVRAALPRRRREHHGEAGRACSARSRPAPRSACTPCAPKWPAAGSLPRTAPGIPFMRELSIYPPLLLDPPMNQRTGQFKEVDEQPVGRARAATARPVALLSGAGRADRGLRLLPPAVHRPGLSLANLFELATEEQIAAGPDAVYVYGVPPAAMLEFGDLPTVFYDDRGQRPAGRPPCRWRTASATSATSRRWCSRCTTSPP